MLFRSQTELQNNIWLTRYNNYITYQKLSEDLEETDKQIAKLSSSKDKQSVEKIQALAKKSEILERQMELLEEFKRSPFSEIIRPPEIAESEKISNPIAIISGFSYIKQLKSQKEEFWRRLYGLEELIDRLCWGRWD